MGWQAWTDSRVTNAHTSLHVRMHAREQATIVGLDRLGMYVKVESKYGSSKLRLPFTRECTDRKVSAVCLGKGSGHRRRSKTG